MIHNDMEKYTDDISKDIDFSESEKIMIDKIYKEFIKAYTGILAKYKDVDGMQIPVFYAHAKMLDKLISTHEETEREMDKALEKYGI